MITLRIDLETYSDVDLKKCGVHKYAESPNFQIMLFGFKFGDGQVRVIDLMAGEKIPPHILSALDDPTVLKTAYNAAFEITCLSRHLGRQLDVTQWRCTSVHALYLGLPGNLSDVGKVVGIAPDKQKMAVGWGLVRYFCIPCKPTKKNGGRTRNLPQHEPEKWRTFVDYCKRDVESEDSIAAKLARFPVPEVEWKLWHLDQRMMNRGVKVDRELVDAAIECDAIFKERLMAEAVRLTGLDNPNSRNQLLAWLQEAEDDDTILDLTKKSVPKILESTNSDVTRQVLALRQELSKTSVSKFHAMARAMCADDCVRGLTQFYGANRTGRWAGRIVQVQNLPQNKLKDIDLARQLLKARDYELLSMMFGTVPDTLSQLIRTAFVARPASRFIPVDFSAIEARVIAWMAWCEWRLEVFKTHGKIYEASAEQMFGLPPGSVTKKSPYRQKGKISELALGYQGGAGALKTMGALEMGLTEEELEPIKVAWRTANPEIVSLWYACERAAKQAVGSKAVVPLTIAGGRTKLVFAYESGFLTITLPSKRKLFYVKPRLETEDLYRETSAGGRYILASAGSLTYEGMDQKTKQWTRLPTYGGKLVENITQAVARDCLAESMLALDAEGYPQLFTVHDEDIVELPYSSPKGLKDVEAVMGRSIAWAKDLPLRGDGFETEYYMKEID
ncbi:bifunctional 3'-5' exonuclease/DNA polymerase [uncultured Caudovirales phage]|uniref:Bifunctional 3'-5' exonuclease/DNA polymerase n=1 Tax=uncultured Caudovirales phage TaxID=2100421 RepID=A0A6J5NLM4_9CAUD|nr:bifunctional 3'-5' exonuclease/DNA polymerase [uncultured Caudovirales phage]